MMEIENETVSFTLQYVSSEMAHFLVTGQNAPVADAALGLWSLGMTLLEVAMLEHPLRSSWGMAAKQMLRLSVACRGAARRSGTFISWHGQDVAPLVCCDHRMRGSAVDSLCSPMVRLSKGRFRQHVCF